MAGFIKVWLQNHWTRHFASALQHRKQPLEAKLKEESLKLNSVFQL